MSRWLSALQPEGLPDNLRPTRAIKRSMVAPSSGAAHVGGVAAASPFKSTTRKTSRLETADG